MIELKFKVKEPDRINVVAKLAVASRKNMNYPEKVMADILKRAIDGHYFKNSGRTSAAMKRLLIGRTTYQKAFNELLRLGLLKRMHNNKNSKLCYYKIPKWIVDLLK